jgi:hypothetical protein
VYCAVGKIAATSFLHGFGTSVAFLRVEPFDRSDAPEHRTAGAVATQETASVDAA